MISSLKELDKAQAEAVEKTDGPVLILAGAGSGKTRVLTHKVAYLLEKGVKAREILAVTFTNKAANEMRLRITKLAGDDYPDLPFVGTFHAFCAKLLRVEGSLIGLSVGFSIYDDGDGLALVKKIYKDLGISEKIVKPKSVLNAISSAKSEMVAPEDYSKFTRTPFGETVSKIYPIYQKELLLQNACDFDDLLLKTVLLFQNYGEVISKYANRFKYVLVDEYQDVNTTQYTLTKLLSSVHGNLTVVGDASQAIYSFRGADFRNILNFKNDFASVAVFNLEQNYRSSGKILSAANSIISQNISHPILTLWTSNDDGDGVTIYNAPNEVFEANYIVEKIISSGLAYSSFGILYRTNAQSRTIEEAFLHAGIPYKLYGGVRFYDRREIKDILSYLRLIANPKDAISAKRAEKLGKRRFDKFKVVREKIEKSAKKIAPIEIIDKVLKATDYLVFIDDSSDLGKARVENVRELRSVAANFGDLVAFLENISLMEGKVTPEVSFEKDVDGGVSLMTIHAAKGLEFDTVFIIGMEEGLFPHSRSLLDTTQLEEERRLAYVATTRARQKLYMTYASQRLYFGVREANMVSRFISDIPEELLTTA